MLGHSVGMVHSQSDQHIEAVWERRTFSADNLERIMLPTFHKLLLSMCKQIFQRPKQAKHRWIFMGTAQGTSP